VIYAQVYPKKILVFLLFLEIWAKKSPERSGLGLGVKAHRAWMKFPFLSWAFRLSLSRATNRFTMSLIFFGVTQQPKLQLLACDLKVLSAGEATYQVSFEGVE
jgi:hypothetical protein